MCISTQNCASVSVNQAIWLNENNDSIKTCAPAKKVNIQLKTSGFSENDEIMLTITEYNKAESEISENIPATIAANGDALYENFEIKGEWLFKELVVKVKKGTYSDKELNEEFLDSNARLFVMFDHTEVKIMVLDARTGLKVEKARVENIRIVDHKLNSVIFEKLNVSGAPYNGQGFQTYEASKDMDAAIDMTSSNPLPKRSMQALNRLLGLYTDETKLPDGYDETWKGHYKTYWGKRLSGSNIEVPDPEDDPPAQVMEYIVEEYQSHRCIGKDGILTVKIPEVLMDKKKVRIELAFWDFPIVKERSGHEDTGPIRKKTTQEVNEKTISIPKETKFAIKWKGITPASYSWGTDFNWVLLDMPDGYDDADDATVTGTTIPPEYMLKYSENIIIKDDEEEFSGIKNDLLSPFCENTKCHFVLFAMQWCQPTWDGIDDPCPEKNTRRSNDKAFISKKDGLQWIKGIHMHMTTMYDPSLSGPYYGVFCGTKTGPRGDWHHGVDLYSGETGNNVAFAVHGGRVRKHSGGNYGFRAYLKLGGKNNNGHPAFHYCHLNSQVTAKHWAKAGQVIGTSGRSQDVNTTNGTVTQEFAGIYPSHLHFEFLANAGKDGDAETDAYGNNNGKSAFSGIRTVSLPASAEYTVPTAENAFLFQGNNIPMMLPCKCHYTNSDITSCDMGASNTYYRTCWAFKRFPYTNNIKDNFTEYAPVDLHPEVGLLRFICPHVLAESADKSVQLQAKVKFLNVNKDRFDPPIFPHEESENTQFNSFFTDRSGMDIDGGIGPITMAAIRELIRARYYCENEGDNRILTEENANIDNVHIKHFVDKYINNTHTIPADDDYEIIRDFYEWFTDDMDFNVMCLNGSIETAEENDNTEAINETFIPDSSIVTV
ncbi:MAG: M23 family metallopeptidase [Rikenellaceae bacterium]|nr:M23 family metallopeptidase [Rikenellaceae bacterium]